MTLGESALMTKSASFVAQTYAVGIAGEGTDNHIGSVRRFQHLDDFGDGGFTRHR